MISTNPNPSPFLHLLNEEFKQRTFANPRYSLRSFARQLKVDPSHLAKVLKGKRRVSEQMVEWAGKSLEWSGDTIARVKDFDGVSRAKTGRKLRLANAKRFDPIAEDDFQIASRWIHFVILEMAELEGGLPLSKEIAQRLGVSVLNVVEAVDRLKRVGALVETPSGYRATKQYTTTKIPGTSPALKRLQKEILSAAARALDEVPVEKRDQSAITMAIDTSKLAEAKDRIRKFRRELMEFLQDGNRDGVYQLAVSFFPVERATSHE